MEPERKIEKVLRALAKRRRDEAGDPFDLHPATRRLLQGEVTRRKPKENPNSSFRSFVFGSFRPGFFSALCILAIVMALSALLLPGLGRAKNKSQRVAELSAQRQEELRKQLEKPAPSEEHPAGTLGGEQKKEPNAGNQLGHTAGSLTLGDRSAGGGSEMATSPGFEPIRLYSYTNSGQVAMAPPATAASGTSGSLSLDTSRLGAVTAADSSLAANKPGSVAQGLAFGGGGVGNELKLRDEKTFSDTVGGATSQKFIRVSEKQDTAKTVSSGRPVLASFEVFQSGRELRIVDSDGSVYNGYVEPGTPPLKEELSAAKNQSETIAKVGQPVALERSQLGIEGYFFHVSGTNLSLKQNVLFTGNLFGATNGFGEMLTKSVDRLRLPAPIAGSVTAPLPNVHISGRVLIENQPQLEIEAVPVSKSPN
jgi:hypothetical protein